MRHKVDGRLFGRPANQRKALLRGLVSSLLEHERIETTTAKAKEVRKIAEKIVTLGIRGDLHAKRLALSYVPNRTVIAKLFSEIAPRFTGRNGGYLRIIHTRQRVNDSAPMSVLEFVDYEDLKKATTAKETKAAKKETEKKS
jgi:large subunit ribosomal protein L17